MSQKIREGNKVYEMNDNGIVVKASEQEPELQAATVAPPKIGSRVEAEGKRGTLHSRTASIYGDTLAVRFDDGSLGEYTASDVQAPVDREDDTVYASSLDEIKAHFANYDSLPAYTLDEMDEKEKVAKQLKLDATNAIRQSGLAFQDRVVLDNIILVTNNDLSELAGARHSVSMEQDTRYQRVAKARYSMSDEIHGYAPLMGAAGNEDASWLDTAMEGMTVTETTEADLAVTATQMIDRLDRNLLENEDVLRDAVSFQEDYLGIQNDDDKKNKFAAYVEEARRTKLETPVVKAASVDDLTDDFDASSLFL